MYKPIKEYLNVILYVITLFSATIIIYSHDLGYLLNEALNNEIYTHLFILPFLFIYLIYLKKENLNSTKDFYHKKGQINYFDNSIGLILIILSLLMYWYGSNKFNYLPYHILSILILYTGITLFLYNIEVLKIQIYPFILLIFLLPPPTDIVYELGGILANINTYISFIILSLFRLPVSISYDYGPPSLILNANMVNQSAFAIDIPCSGIYTFIGFILFSAFFILIIESDLSKKLLIFLMGFILFDILNILRIITIIFIAHFFSSELAIKMFHFIGGILLNFVGIMLLFSVSKRVFKIKFSEIILIKCPMCDKFIDDKEHFCLNCGNYLYSSNKTNNKIFLGKIITILLISFLAVTLVNIPSFTASSPVDMSNVKSLETPSNVLPEIPEYNLVYLYRDLDFEEISNQDASLIYAYHPKQIPSNKSSVIVTIGVADTVSNLHSWEVCLVTYQIRRGKKPLVDVISEEDIQLDLNSSKILRYLVFIDERNLTQSTLYWYEKASFTYGAVLKNKYVRISLLIFDINPDIKRNKQQLLQIGNYVAAFWAPIQRQALISLGIPFLQASILVFTGLLVIIKIGQYVETSRKMASNQKIFNRLASKEEKNLRNQINEIFKDKKYLSNGEIKQELFKKYGHTTSLEEVNKLFKQLENYGIVKQTIDNNNYPKQYWTKK